MPSARDVRRAEKLLALVEERRARVVSDFYEMGSALGELRQRRHYLGLGYASFEALLKGRKLMSRATAYRLIAIAQSLSRDEAMSLGVEKAYGIIELGRAIAPDAPPATLIETFTLDGVPVKELPGSALRDAARAARSRQREDPSSRSPLNVYERARRAAVRLERSLHRRGADDATVTVRVAGAGPRLVVDIDPEDVGLLS